MRKIHIKCCVQFVALVLIITFPNLSVSSYYHPWETGACGSTNLSPQIRSNPLLNDEIKDEHMLKTFLMCKAAQIPDIFERETDMYSDLGPKTVKVLFTRSSPLAIKGMREKGAPESVRVIPCFMDNEPFYAYLVRYRDGQTRIGVNTGQGHEAYCGGLVKDGRLSAKDFESLRNGLLLEDSDIATVDISDGSVSLAGEFLERIGAERLKQELEAVVKGGKMIVTKGAILVSGGMGMDSTRDELSRAWSIVEQLMLSAGEGMSYSDIGRFREAFKAFRLNKGSFDLENFAPELKLLVLSLESGPGNQSNEGGLKLLPCAYERMIDISDVTMEDCENEGIIADIRKVFEEIAELEIDDYNGGLVKQDVPHMEWRIEPEDMPGYGSRLLIKRLSNGLLPTAVSTEDGVVIVNENFVKVMYKLAKYGLKSFSGRIIRRRGQQILGDIYWSILYSMAIHEIRGHYKIEKGRVMLNTNEDFAQGERGKNKRYLNLVATVYFLFEIAETRERLTSEGKTLYRDFFGQETGDAIRSLMKDNPQLFRGLDEWQKDELHRQVIISAERFVTQGFHSGYCTYPEKIPTMPVPEMRKTTPFSVLRVLISWERAMEERPSKGKALDVYEIAARLGADPEKVAGHIDILLKVGVVNRVAQSGNKSLSMEYYKSKVFGRRRCSVKNILDTLKDTASHILRDAHQISKFHIPRAAYQISKLIPDAGDIGIEGMSEAEKVKELLALLVKAKEVTMIPGNPALEASSAEKFDRYHITPTTPDQPRPHAFEKIFACIEKLPEDAPIDIEEIAGALGADPEKVKEQLDILAEAAEIRKVVPEEALPLYTAAQVPDNSLREVEEILNGLGNTSKEADLMEARVKIAGIIRDNKEPRKDTPGQEDTEGDVGYSWAAATAVFRVLSSEGGVFTAADIAEKLGDTDPGIVSAGISKLTGIGIVNEYVKRGGEVLGRPLYGTARVAGARAREVLEILDSVLASPAEVDFPELRAKILNVIDPVWANAFVDAVVKDVGAEAVRETGKKMVIAVETGWVPETQKAFIQGLIQDLDKLESKGTVRIVRGSADELAGKLLNVVKEERTPLKNIIVLADKKTIVRKEFAPIRARNDNDTDKAFIVGVDAEKLTDDSYIRLMEMLTMAVRMSLGLKPLSNHPEIEIGRVNSRLYIFMPKAEPVDLETIKALYNTQRRVLTAA
ncbi:MAG: hypothetical protein U9R44_06665 [Candidatus Omnitrophota bacterium]|nr:hypothetical protein [Candidatus Omnitrophota bacterium]